MSGLLVAGLALSGCSTPEDVSDESREAVTGLISSQPELSVAHSIALGKCLEAEGFDRPVDLTSSGAGSTNLLGLGLFDSEQQAKTSGYASSVQTLDGEDDTPLGRWLKSLSNEKIRRYEIALSGDESSSETYVIPGSEVQVSRASQGCIAEADRAVYGSVKASMEIQEFPNEVFTVVQQQNILSEETITELMTDYASCMKSSGYEVESLGATKTLAQKRFGESRPESEPPGPDEAALAVADYRCQVDSEIAAKSEELFYEHSASWVVNNEARILQFYESQRESLDRANEIIQGG
ncbi:MAG: hypothetical protein ACOH1T_08005 [Microbacteriaceae bacterium]